MMRVFGVGATGETGERIGEGDGGGGAAGELGAAEELPLSLPTPSFLPAADED